MAGFEVTLYGRIWVTPEDLFRAITLGKCWIWVITSLTYLAITTLL